MSLINMDHASNTEESAQHSFIFNEHHLQHYTDAITQGVNLIKQALESRQQPFTGILPRELASVFEGIDLDMPKHSLAEALEEIDRLYLKDAVYFHKPTYVAHLNCPIVYPAILAELILSSINSSVDTWDQSAGGTLIEQKLIDWTCQRIIGLGPEADGIFTSGGTQSNLMAMLLARDHYCRRLIPGYDAKQSGLPLESCRFRIFSSEVSHFSVQKSAALLGLGYQAVVSVKCDDDFAMDPQALNQQIQEAKAQGLIPIAVVATAGTTDFGSIDPLPVIADLCREHDLWFHVDAAYGCGLLASPTRRHLLNGIEQADSVTVDYHKSFLQPVSCSAFFVRDKTNLGCVTHHADYLNPLSAQQEGTPNLVNKSLQTTRRFDALKLWLTLRTVGLTTIGEIFDQVCELARTSYRHLQNDPQIQLIHSPQLSTLVFRWLPDTALYPQLRIDQSLLNEINLAVRKTIFRSGQAVIASTRVNGQVFLKFTLLNPQTRMQDIEKIIQLIKEAGRHHLQNLHTNHAIATSLPTPQNICCKETI